MGNVIDCVSDKTKGKGEIFAQGANDSNFLFGWKFSLDEENRYASSLSRENENERSRLLGFKVRVRLSRVIEAPDFSQ